MFNRKCKSFHFLGVSIFTFEGGWITLYHFFTEGFDTLLDFWVPEFDEPETYFSRRGDEFSPFDAYVRFKFELNIQMREWRI